MGTKRYYWLKLSENFFNSNEMRYLENQENGYAYVVLYIKLMLLGMNTGGELYFNGNKPFNKNTISMVTGFPCSVTEEALAQFLDLGMIEMTDSGVIKLCNYDDVVGSESSSAVRMRRKRETYGEASHCDGRASHCDIEREKDKEKEIDIDIYKEREEETPDGDHTHPEINKPSFDEVKEYCRERGDKVDAEKFYDHYCAVGWMMGKSPMQDWKAAIRKWEKTERQPQFSGGKKTDSAQNTGSFDTDDFFEAALRRSMGEDT